MKQFDNHRYYCVCRTTESGAMVTSTIFKIVKLENVQFKEEEDEWDVTVENSEKDNKDNDDGVPEIYIYEITEEGFKQVNYF